MTIQNEITPRRPSPRVRKNEVIGGGFFVFRRGKRTGRVGIKTSVPFEHPDYASAVREAARLAAMTGDTFEVFETTGTTTGATNGAVSGTQDGVVANSNADHADEGVAA